MSPMCWCIVRGAHVHIACLTEEEAMLTMLFKDKYATGADKPCERCGVPLNEVPEP